MPPFYRVELSGNQPPCKCAECRVWTIVSDDHLAGEGEVTEIGQSWKGPAGKETADDVCDLMNMAFDAGAESATLGPGAV